MNIAFFLIPKSEVVYVYDEWTMRQVMEKMEYHRYSAVPILNKDGHYVGTITEGDLLWKLKNSKNLDLQQTEKIKLSEIEKHVSYEPISINSQIEDIMKMSLNQNFVPVVDDYNIFIGIIRRREIIESLQNLYKVDMK
ncbi:CBS domain-containing protein [Niallia sp. 01092]|uniref:CBS domain-containing protein n=1 Tax=unclassified Niallia TaxID=2837522 RepID=UPI003FD639F2